MPKTEHLSGVERLIQQQLGMPPRLLFILAGPSGVGKNTIIKRLLQNHGRTLARIITHTTREPRDGEIEGEQYYFVSKEQFFELARQDALLEVDGVKIGHDVYQTGDLYSMPKPIFRDIPTDCHLVIAEVDIDGTRLLKEQVEYAVSIFLTAPPPVLIERIRERDDDDMKHAELAQRLRMAHDHMEAATRYDYVVFNEEDRIDATVEAIEKIIAAERMRLRGGVTLLDALPEDAFVVAEAERQPET